MDYNLLAVEYARHRQVHPLVLQRLVEQSQIGPGSLVLEVGCGTGNYLQALIQATGCEGWGIDPSAGMLAKAAGHLGQGHLRLGSAEGLDFPDAAFDLVFSVDVIHHIVKPAEAYREAWRVLKPGGWICTVTDSEWIIRHRIPLSVYFPETIELELARYPKIPDLKSMMAASGFHAIREETVEFGYERMDLESYRDKAYSSLHLIPEEAFQRGLRRMADDLEKGPIHCVSYYLLLWGLKSGSS
jgi:SAM-dependent methyltransferase